MNDPVSHDPAWPAIPNKLPSDIPKLEGAKLEKILVSMSLLFTFGAPPIPYMKIQSV